MKFLFASDSFKGTLSSQNTGVLLAQAAREIFPGCEYVQTMVADGGEGTTDAVLAAAGGTKVSLSVHGPLGHITRCSYGLLDSQRAVMEMAAASGLPLVSDAQKDPRLTSTYGTGEMIADALKRGLRDISIAVGGSATNDGGMGLLQELGLRFYDKENKSLICGAYSLGKIDHIDTSRFMDLDHVKILAAADVRNPLLGPKGATFTFGRQKGLFPSQLTMVDHWMRRYRDVMQKTFGIDLDTIPGGGAAGGIGAVLAGILHAQIQSGITMCIEGYQLENVIQKADIVITGEGQTDLQTRYGKVPFGVAQLAKKYHKPVLCLSGALGLGYQELYQDGFDGLYSSADRAMDFMTALKNGPEKLENLAFSITKTIDAIARMEDDQ